MVENQRRQDSGVSAPAARVLLEVLKVLAWVVIQVATGCV